MRLIKTILPSLALFTGYMFVTAASNTAPDLRARKVQKEFFHIIDSTSNKIARVFTGEWVEVVAANNGDIIINGDTLTTNTSKITDHKSKEDINLHKPVGFNGRMTIVDDTLLRICRPDTSISTIELFLFNEGNKFIKENILFEADTAFYNLAKIDSSYYFHINAPDRIIEQYSIKSLPVFKTPITAPETIVQEETSIDTTKLIVLIGISVALIAIVVIIFFQIRKRRSKPIQMPDKESDGNHIPDNNNTTTGASDESSENKLQDDMDYNNRERQSLIAKNNKLEEDIRQIRRDYDDKLRQKQQECDDRIRDVKNKANEDAENKYSKRLADRESQINRLNDDIRRLEEKAINQINTIKEQELEKRQQINKELDNTRNSLSTTRNELKAMTADRDDKATRLETQIAANKTFTTQFAALGKGAMAYASQIDNLIKVKEQILQACANLTEEPIDDRYDIYRLIANFESQTEELSLGTSLYAPISLLANTGFVMRSNPLSSFASVSDNDKLKEGVQRHFYDQTKGLISALVVLNESMIGLPVITRNMVSKSQVTRFVQLRTALDNACRGLGIIVETMHVGDDVGFKVDLVVENVDLDLPYPGTIVCLDNCIVYLETDGRPADQRIHVKAQS